MDLGDILNLILSQKTSAQAQPQLNDQYGKMTDTAQEDPSLLVPYQTTDSNGNPMTGYYNNNAAVPVDGSQNLYKPITGLAAYYHPDAVKYVNEQNAQNAQKVYGAGRAQAIYGTPVNSMSPEDLAIATGGNNTSQNINGVAQAQSENANGTPEEKAWAARQQSEFSGREYNADNRLNVPEWNAQAAKTRGINTNLFMNAERPNIYPQAALTGLGIKYDTGNMRSAIQNQPTTLDTQNQKIAAANIRASGDLDASTYDAQDYINKARTEAGISGVRYSMLPTEQNTVANNIRNASIKSGNPSPLSNPLTLNPDGSIDRNPYYANMMTTMNAKMAPDSGTQPHIPLISGLVIGPSQSSSGSGNTNGIGGSTANTNGIPAHPLRTLSGTIPSQPLPTNSLSSSDAKGQGVNSPPVGKTLQDDTNSNTDPTLLYLLKYLSSNNMDL